ncbi:MAG TPA: DUF4159 domain-containing protein [Candidatus Dormibacteraeota bacterium]|nr:DUF4159 domain-containing protein [Candidatus Dormibacteraeota bacterium]
MRERGLTRFGAAASGGRLAVRSSAALLSIALILCIAASVGFAQRRRGGGWRGGGGGGGEGWTPEFETCKTAREVPSHSTGTPNWTNEPGFDKDVFSFVRIRRDRASSGSWSAGNWHTDFPDSDLNLSFRLQQVTSLRTNPDGRVLRFTEPELFDYPWIYMVEVGSLELRDEEVPFLRKYLLNGGVLMADDFWGQVHWNQFESQIKRALPEPEYTFTELPMDHPIFHCVFDLKVPKNKLQTPNIGQGMRSEYDGVTWEYHDGEECKEMHVRAMLDKKGRIMVIATHNCDNGDGWEREGESDYFFHEFSEKRAYPLGFNIVFYIMTH